MQARIAWVLDSMSRLLSPWLFLGLVCLAAAPARGGTVIASNLPTGYSLSSFAEDAGFQGNTSNGFFNNEAAAQEFTAAASGQVTTLIATVDQFQAEGVPLIVSFYAASGLLPGPLLGSVSFAPNLVSTNTFVTPSTLDVSSANVNMVAGQSYFVVFSVATPISESSRYRIVLLNENSSFFGFSPLDSQNAGASWFTSPVPNEVGLTLIGTAAVPEPSTVLLLLTGSPIVLTWFARRRLIRGWARQA